MDYIKTINSMKIARTRKALEKNGMNTYLAEDHEELLDIIKNIVPEGSTVSCGGSVSLSEAGVTELLKSGRYNFLDRSAPGLTAEDIADIYTATHSADAFFTSSNAVTENGELYNVDGNANRVSCIAHGPKKVIVIVGVNKIVKDMDAAVYRVKTVAAPCNGIRLNTQTPCAITGKCIAANGAMTDGCSCEKRMCVHYLISAFQRNKERFHVIFLNEELGY